MLDFERLAFMLLERGRPGLTVTPTLDVDSIDDFPILLFTVTGGQAVPGFSPPQAWEVTLDVTIQAEGMDATRLLAGDVYDDVWAWNDPFTRAGIVDGLGHVSAIEDQAVFTRIITAIVSGREITQYSGSFTMQMHAA